MAETNVVGMRIAEARKRLGLTQAQLADLLGSHAVTVNRWEKGRQVPEGETLGRLAQALHVDEGWILRGESAAGVTPAALDARTREAFDLGFRTALEIARKAIDELAAPAIARHQSALPPTAPAEPVPRPKAKRRRAG